MQSVKHIFKRQEVINIGGTTNIRSRRKIQDVSYCGMEDTYYSDDIQHIPQFINDHVHAFSGNTYFCLDDDPSTPLQSSYEHRIYEKDLLTEKAKSICENCQRQWLAQKAINYFTEGNPAKK